MTSQSSKFSCKNSRRHVGVPSRLINLLWSTVIYITKDVAPQLSEYANTLSPLVKKRYMQKIAYIGVDPFVIFHAKNTMPNVFLPPSRLTSFRILFLKPVTTIRNNLRPLKVFKHITSWSLDLYKVSTDLSLPVSRLFWERFATLKDERLKSECL